MHRQYCINLISFIEQLKNSESWHILHWYYVLSSSRRLFLQSTAICLVYSFSFYTLFYTLPLLKYEKWLRWRKRTFHVFNNIINHCNCFNDFNSVLSRSGLTIHSRSIWDDKFRFYCFEFDWGKSLFMFSISCHHYRYLHLKYLVFIYYTSDQGFSGGVGGADFFKKFSIFQSF